MREARLRPLVLVLRGATMDLRWMMSSPSKRLVGEPSRSGLGSTGETPARAQQPRSTQQPTTTAMSACTGANAGAGAGIGVDATNPVNAGAATGSPRAR